RRTASGPPRRSRLLPRPSERAAEMRTPGTHMSNPDTRTTTTHPRSTAMTSASTAHRAATTTTPVTHRSAARRIAGYAGWELLRNVRMVESTFFIVVLPTVLYIMFGALSSWGDGEAGHGN